MRTLLPLVLMVILPFHNTSFVDELNLETGEYTMDMGGGDKMKLDSGEYIMNLK